MSRLGDIWFRIRARLTGVSSQSGAQEPVDGPDPEAAPEDDSLDAQAWRRARDLDAPHAGTPFDWEDWERYRKNKPADGDG